ncbi:hypothetical protein AAII07_59765 [Microvirga sp. 0TCS3.31]
MKKISVIRDVDIPPLAWFFSADGDSVSVVCGRSVIVEPDGFFEGAWATESVSRWDFSTSPNLEFGHF